MQKNTPIGSPRIESLNFIRAFARFYSPIERNEKEARYLAYTTAYGTSVVC